MKNKEKEPLGQRICRALDLPPEILPNITSLELQGRSLLKICGGGAILLYSPEEIRIATHPDGYVSVKGYALRCSSYNMGAVGIEGRICSLCFCEGDEK